MRSLPSPPISAELSYTTAICRVQDADLKRRLQGIVLDVVGASDRFEEAATVGTVASIPPASYVGAVTGDELRGVYKSRFAKLMTPGRLFYDQLVTSAPFGTCPLCAHRAVTTLDHFLPQDDHPALVVTPANLVPACSDCNKAKLDHMPASEDRVTLHPYFDSVESDEWLVADVEETQPAAVRFWARTPDDWPRILAERLPFHFAFFGLAELYAAQAAVELLNIRFGLQAIFDANGQAGVAAHLAHEAASRAHAHVNSWQTGTYKALAASPWFCAGGFA
jgi:hypothetical protein